MIGRGFRGAVDYVDISRQAAAERQITYTGKEEAEETVPQKIRGDVDANRKFERADIDMMTDFLRTKGTLTDWQAGDFDENGLISAADLSLMKNAFAILNP